MFNLSAILSDLQAAIAVVAARDRRLTAVLVAVWGRIGRMRTRLERLVALWRAGMLPAPRPPRTGAPRPSAGDKAERPKSAFPTTPAWLTAAVRAANQHRGQLEHLLSQEDCVAFLAACPQARRIIRPLRWMLGIGVSEARLQKPRPDWWAMTKLPVPAPAGLVVGPDGRMVYV